MLPVARTNDATQCPAVDLVTSPAVDLIPHLGGPLSTALPVCLEVDGRAVIRLGDNGRCVAGPLDVVFEGAATFTVCGLPVARMGDQMAHTGTIIEGSPHFIVGGPTFALPANFSVVGPTDFRNKVIRDLYLLSTTSTGKVVIDTLSARGFPLMIQPEAWSQCGAMDATNTENGVGTGSVVLYNPENRLLVEGDGFKPIHFPSQVILGHELIHALHNAMGVHKPGKEVYGSGLGPVTEPDIPLEEEWTIGVGQFSNNYPSENSLRRELGLPQRVNHFGYIGLPRRFLPGPNHNALPGFEKFPIWEDNRIAPIADLRPGEC
jgi:uncharacterized Zn-binding protein involved in type VI secretion